MVWLFRENGTIWTSNSANKYVHANLDIFTNSDDFSETPFYPMYQSLHSKRLANNST
jgi:hypothetical protein